jgi:hypothetical protein
MISSTKTKMFSQQPNWAFNADANSCHGFAIFMAAVGSLRPSGCAAR